MRAVLAGLAVFGVLLLAVGTLGEIDAFETFPPVVVGGVLGLLFVALCAVVLRLFNAPGANLSGFVPFEEQVRELEQQDLLVATDYEAVRAFAVEEFEDEGSHYFLELKDGRVLFLSGQYLYETDPEDGRRRRFPCTDFALRHHRTAGHPVDLLCRGRVLEPELTAPAASIHPAFGGDFPDDGRILDEETYDDLKARLMATEPR